VRSSGARGRANPSNWLITIAHNIVGQRFRRQRARPTEVELDSDRVAAQQADDSGPTMDELVRGLQRLPPFQRDALVLREFEGRSYKEIQELLGLTAAAVETLLFRARRSLAEELDNLVTCERAELAMSKHADGRLPWKERRRLDAHLRDCPSCAHLDAKQSKYRRAFKGLALVPLPLSLTLFKGTPSASAAAGLSTIGAGGAAGGLVAGGVIAKIAVVVAAVTLP
jgi:Sigma-70, region 4/Putative zinc-finger